MHRIIATVVAAGVALSGCATKRHVSRQVGTITSQVEGLASELSLTGQRVLEVETRAGEANTRALRALAGAEEAAGTAHHAIARAEEAERTARGKLIYTLTLSSDQVTFPFGRARVADEAKLVIDEAVRQLTAENKGVYFEIEGHTDSTGPAAYNLKLGEERAQAVRGYLHDHHGIALNRIAVISYGEKLPLVGNETSTQRAQNRRVVIKVVE